MTEPVSAAHLSKPVRARSSRIGVDFTIQVVQSERVAGFPDSGQPYVSLVAQFPDYGPDHPADEYLLCFDSELAQTVGRILLTAGRAGSPRPIHR